MASTNNVTVIRISLILELVSDMDLVTEKETIAYKYVV